MREWAAHPISHLHLSWSPPYLLHSFLVFFHLFYKRRGLEHNERKGGREGGLINKWNDNHLQSSWFPYFGTCLLQFRTDAEGEQVLYYIPLLHWSLFHSRIHFRFWDVSQTDRYGLLAFITSRLVSSIFQNWFNLKMVSNLWITNCLQHIRFWVVSQEEHPAYPGCVRTGWTGTSQGCLHCPQ